MEAASSRPHAPVAMSNNAAERRHVAVLFYDIVGSASLATALDAEDGGTSYARIWTMCRRRSRRWRFTATTLGDGIMALFGYPSLR